MNGHRVLLIGWSAADWKLLHPLLDAGDLPNLAGLLARGAMGTLTAPQPLVRPLLWTSLATGVRAFRHGILAGEKDATAGETRKSPAFWDSLRAQGRKTNLVNWPLTQPPEETGGVCVSDAFFALSGQKKNVAASELVCPPGVTPALAKLRIAPEEVDDETLRHFIPELQRAGRGFDERLERLKRAVARTLSVHAVTTALLEKAPAEVTAVRFDLLAELAPWALPLAPPKLEAVGQLEFEIYEHVLAGACRVLDLLLGTLLKLAGPETTTMLVSEHGLLVGNARIVRSPRDLKKADAWRTRNGLVVLAGAGLRRDEIIFGANLLDIAPTLLAGLNVPVSVPMDGHVLVQAFSEPPAPAAPVPFPPAETEAAPSLSGEATDEEVARAWSRVRSMVDGGQAKRASPLVQELVRVRPDRVEFMRALFEGQLMLRQLGEARETLERVLDWLWETPQAALLQARLEYAARRFDVSLRQVESIAPDQRDKPWINHQIGLNLVKLNRNAQARESFSRELELHPECAESWAGLAYCSLREGHFRQTVEQALKAVALNFQLFYAHFFLGLAHAKLGEVERGLISLRLAAQLAPQFAAVHRALAILYAHEPGQSELAARHRELARTARIHGWGF